MKVLINTEALPDSQWHWDPAAPVSGTSKFYVRVAEGLAAKGHQVTVVFDGKIGRYRGVNYYGRHPVFSDVFDADVQLDCNIIAERRAARRVHWTSLYKSRDFLTASYDHVFLLSRFHASTIIRGDRLPANVSLLPLGSDVPFVAPGSESFRNRERTCFYSSSPDRGGTLLQQCWPEIEAATGYRLVTSPYDSDSDVAEVYRSSRFWLHPAHGVELFCVSAIEAQSAGCIPIVVPHMALAETVRYGVKTDLFRFQQTVIDTLKAAEDWGWVETMMASRRDALAADPIATWAEIVDLVEARLQ